MISRRTSSASRLVGVDRRQSHEEHERVIDDLMEVGRDSASPGGPVRQRYTLLLRDVDPARAKQDRGLIASMFMARARREEPGHGTRRSSHDEQIVILREEAPGGRETASRNSASAPRLSPAGKDSSCAMRDECQPEPGAPGAARAEENARASGAARQRGIRAEAVSAGAASGTGVMRNRRAHRRQ